MIKNQNFKHNSHVDDLINDAVNNNEGVIGLNGALMVDTGIFTGRSPKDKYFVEEDYSKNLLWWGPVNKKIDKNVFDRLFSKIIDFYKSNNNKTYVFEGFAGADYNNQIKAIFYSSMHFLILLYLLTLYHELSHLMLLQF